MPISEIGDPRLQELFGAEAAAAAGVKPVVRLPRKGASGWAIAGAAFVAALVLFWVLESRRGPQPAPAVRPGPDSVVFSPERPPLYIPPAPPRRLAIAPSPVTIPEPGRAPVENSRAIEGTPPPFVYERPLPQPPVAPPQPQRRTSSGAALVIDTTASSGAKNSPAAHPGVQSDWGGRARASTLANPTNTVAQGALIPAVLETGFNSTSPGLARAIVSRDVRGFDGTKVLIPRGSRLIGEYRSDVTPGQNRALINWTRLIRPDGVTVDLDSPSTDTLGRGGVQAHVDSHFWTRFGDALLRTTADIGSSIASRAATGSVFVAVPGSVDQSARAAQSKGIVPTLTIKPGTSISVFVARDLEFPE